MQNLVITAHLARGFVAYDNWSPCLDSLIQLAILDERGLRSPNPSPEEVAQNQPLLDEATPLASVTLGDFRLWSASAPHYELMAQQTTTYYKRWTGHETGLDWGGKKPAWNESAGFHKNYNLPNYGRITPAVCWFVRGDRAEILRLLAGIPAIGKKISQGNGLVSHWSADEVEADYSIVASGRLSKIVPVAAAKDLDVDLTGCAIARRTYAPPYWQTANAINCWMPCANVWEPKRERDRA